MATIRAFWPARGSVFVAALAFHTCLFAQTAANPQAVIQAGAEVSFDYTLTDDTGTVINSSKGKAPMNYTHGKGQIIPGLERELTGMAVGAEKKVTVKPEDAYGQFNPQAFQEVAKDKLPPVELKVGIVLTAEGPQGQGIPVRVHEIKEKTVIIDFNHPLAGKTLSYDVKITAVKPAAK